MTRQHRMTQAAVLLAFATMSVAAQNTEPPQRTDREGLAQDQKPAGRAEPMLLKFATVLGTDVLNSKQEKLGRIEELLIETSSGRIRDAVLALAGNHHEKRVAIRWEALAWDPLTQKCLHESTREQLERAPVWRPENPASQKEPGVTAREEKPREREAIDLQGSGEKPAPADASLTKGNGIIAGTRLSSLRVSAGTDDLGTPSDLYAEVRTGSVAFMALTLGDVLGIGGKTYLVPWRAVTLQSGNDQKPLLRIANMDRKQIENAPKMASKDDIQNPTFRGRVYQFFGVRLPEYEPDHDLLGKGGETQR